MFLVHPLIKPNTVELRKYQESIIASSVQKNTLIILPTGLGKTLIAAIVAVYKLDKFKNSKILFLAPTKPLVVQHSRTFKEILNIPEDEISVFTASTPVKDREMLWNKSRLIFATPQTIENEIMRNLSLKDVSLIVFDEAHRAVGDYSYVYIASEYVKNAENPHIIGLTASPSSESEKINEICSNLNIEQIETRNEFDKDVKPYIQKVTISWVKVDLPPEFKEIRDQLVAVLKEYLISLKAAGYIDTIEVTALNKKDLLEIQSKIQNEIYSGEKNYELASLIAQIIKMQYALELLETQGVYSLYSYLERLKLQRNKSTEMIFRNEKVIKILFMVEKLKNLGVEHPKLNELEKIISNRKNQKILVFTQYRDTVEKIVEKLSLSGISCKGFIGQGVREKKKGMTQKEQIKILDEFKNNVFNVLVATSVAEEGLDIPKVDVVIFYEPIPSEIRSIQRRGRTGRSHTGEVIILIAKKTRDEAYYYSSVYKEKKMNELIRGIKEAKSDFGQQSILKYQGEGAEEGTEVKNKIKIYVDIRERGTEIFRELRECNTEIIIKQLEVGDYILSDRVGVERKNAEDFLQSIIDRRLFEQAKNLSKNFQVPLMIVEGQIDYSKRNIHPNAVRGAIASLVTDFGISIIPTCDEKDTAGMLFAIAKREQEEGHRMIALRGEKTALTLAEKQRFIIESLPNVSSVLAERLLLHFGSVKNVIEASENELKKVEGIGKKKAQEIRKVIVSKYEKK